MLELGRKHLRMGLNNARNVRMELRIAIHVLRALFVISA